MPDAGHRVARGTRASGIHRGFRRLARRRRGAQEPRPPRLLPAPAPTGLRRAEASTLTWEQVRGDHVHLPMTKNGRSFNLPITPAHHALLEPLRDFDPEYVFPALRGKRRPMTAPAPLPWSAHTHRRTFHQIAIVEAGLFEEMADRLINHTVQTVGSKHYLKITHEVLAPYMAARRHGA